MIEPWDRYPVVPPFYPHMWRAGESLEGSQRELFMGEGEDEDEAEKLKSREAYERYVRTIDADFRREKPGMVQQKIDLLRLCRKTPAAKRQHLLRHVSVLDGCVYLMWCPNLRLYKIGHTDNLQRRLRQHRRTLDRGAVCLVAYYTPLERQMLEEFVLRHFRESLVPPHCLPTAVSWAAKELFDLDQTEADGFKAVVKVVERPLLAVELVRLEALVSKFEAECQ